METMMKKPAGADAFTIRCRVRPNWIRISILTLAVVAVSWLGFGAFCSLMDGQLSFWQALITPLALIFVAIDAVTSFVRFRNKDLDETNRITKEDKTHD